MCGIGFLRPMLYSIPMKKLLICICFFFYFFNFLFSQEILENGMSVYILPDTSEATVHAEFIVRAGYIHQNEKNAGFIPLYAKVFSETIKNSQWLNSYGVTFSYECSDMATKYAFTFPPQVLDVVLENLAMQIFEPVYTDSAILESYIQTKEDSKNIASAVTGFINRQIESTILKIIPYQQKA